MVHEVLAVGMLACNCSIIGDESSRQAIVVDPGDEAEQILGVLRHHRLKLNAIVLTHAHLDHLGAAARLRSETGAPVYLHADDLAVYAQLEEQALWLGMQPPEKPSIDRHFKEGDQLQVGTCVLEVLHTPGHTPGSISLWIPSHKKLIAGDTLFRESIGRTDLPGGDSHKILQSIRDKFLPLPPETVVIPGHGPATTLAHERRYNFFLQRL